MRLTTVHITAAAVQYLLLISEYSPTYCQFTRLSTIPKMCFMSIILHPKGEKIVLNISFKGKKLIQLKMVPFTRREGGMGEVERGGSWPRNHFDIAISVSEISVMGKPLTLLILWSTPLTEWHSFYSTRRWQGKHFSSFPPVILSLSISSSRAASPV